MKKWMQKNSTNIRRITCLLVFAISISYISYYIYNSMGNKNLYNQLNRSLNENIETFYGISKIDVTLLKRKNPDTVGWISIPGSTVNYPVVQGEDNEFYLNNNFYKKPSNFGSIYLDTKIDPAKIGTRYSNTVIYGHNMYDGQMFSFLLNYIQNDENQKYFDDNSEFMTLFDKKIYKWQIFSAYKTDRNFDYLQSDFKDSNDYEGFLIRLVKNSTYKNNIQVGKEDAIITLSTCYTSIYYDRIAIHAKLTGVENVKG